MQGPTRPPTNAVEDSEVSFALGAAFFSLRVTVRVTCHRHTMSDGGTVGRESGVFTQVTSFLQREEDESEGNGRWENMTPSFYHFFGA